MIRAPKAREPLRKTAGAKRSGEIQPNHLAQIRCGWGVPFWVSKHQGSLTTIRFTRSSYLRAKNLSTRTKLHQRRIRLRGVPEVLQRQRTSLTVQDPTLVEKEKWRTPRPLLAAQEACSM